MGRIIPRQGDAALAGGEATFSSLFATVGRPNWSVARMLGCMLLQELENRSDQEFLDSLSFDIRYQHALGVAGDQAYLSRRSLVGFRSRLVERDPEMKMVRELFERILSAALDDLSINTREQRIDSTWITSNIRTVHHHQER